ncbi:MAG TPA: hypothetical protein VMT93_02575 [Gemmatimonadaceae bacterium]|nr:hypothetical protein [Gemmatimonadaceae bacterium]
MLKALIILLIGICAGYWLGWDDAQTYSKPVYVRAIEAVGGANRDKVRTDPDAQIDSLEKK